jgi:hypothetical protein
MGHGFGLQCRLLRRHARMVWRDLAYRSKLGHGSDHLQPTGPVANWRRLLPHRRLIDACPTSPRL